MTDKKTNTEHLHEEGVINKDELDADQAKSIDSLSQEEIEHLKSISKKIKSDKAKPVGIML